MTTQAQTGVGAVIRYNSGSGYARIAEVTNISGPNMSKDMVDVTSLSSTDGYREFIAGLRDPGTLTFTMMYVRADYNAMKTLFESDDNFSFELVLKTGDSFEFVGSVTDLPLEVPETAVTCNVSIKISGKVTTNTGSASA